MSKCSITKNNKIPYCICKTSFSIYHSVAVTTSYWLSGFKSTIISVIDITRHNNR